MNPGGVSNIGLGFTFSARDMASGAFGVLGGNFSRLHSAITRGAPQIGAAIGAIAGSAAMLSGGLRVLRGSFDLAQQAGEFGMAIADVGSITRATDTQLQGLRQSAIEAGIATQFSPTEAAEGLRNLASNGVQATDAMRALVPVLDFAAAGNLSVGESADVAMAAINAYGLSVDDITMVTDKLLRGTQLTALRANEFITVLGRAASTGHMFGQGLEDVIISLGSMRSAGIPATVAATAYGEAQRRVFADTANQRRLLREFGVSVQDSAGNLRLLHEVAFDLRNAMNGLTEAEKARIVTEVFHVRGMQSFNAIANIQARTMRDGREVTLQGAEAIRYYKDQVASAAGVTASFRERRLETFLGAMRLLEGTVQTLGNVIGEVFGMIFDPMVRLVTNTLNQFIQIWNNIPDSVKRTIGIITLISGALSVFGGTLGIVVTSAVALIAVFGNLLLVVAAVSAGIVAAMAPIGIAVAGVIAFGYGIYRAWYENLGGLGDFVERWSSRLRRLWSGVESIFTTGRLGRGQIRELIRNNEGGLLQFLRAVERVYIRGSVWWRGFTTEFERVWQRMEGPLQRMREALDALFRQALISSTSFMNQVGKAPTEEWEQFGATTAGTVGNAFSYLAVSVADIADGIRYILTLFESPTWQFISDVFKAIGGVIEGISNLADRGAAISQMFNPLNWLYAGYQGITGQEVTAQPLITSLSEGTGIGGLRRFNPFEATPATRVSSEAAVERPPPTTQGTGRSSLSPGDFRNMIEQLSSNRPPINIRSTTTLVADGRQLAEVEETQRISRTTYGGGMYRGEDQGMSVWGR